MLDVYVALPVDPTDEELARDWMLSVPDLKVERARRSHGKGRVIETGSIASLRDEVAVQQPRGPAERAERTSIDSASELVVFGANRLG